MEAKDPQTRTLRLPVDGMTCGHCEASVRAAAEGVAGVSAAQADAGAGELTLSLAESASAEAEIGRAHV